MSVNAGRINGGDADSMISSASAANRFVRTRDPDGGNLAGVVHHKQPIRVQGAMTFASGIEYDSAIRAHEAAL